MARGLDIVPADGVNHLVIDAIDEEEYDIQNDFDLGCEFIAKYLPKGPVLGFVSDLSISALCCWCFKISVHGYLLLDEDQQVVFVESLFIRKESKKSHKP